MAAERCLTIFTCGTIEALEILYELIALSSMMISEGLIRGKERKGCILMPKKG